MKLPKTVNPNDFVYGKEAYQLYLSNKRQLDRLEKEEIEPQISLLRQRLIEKRDRIDDALYKAKGDCHLISCLYMPCLIIHSFLSVQVNLSSF